MSFVKKLKPDVPLMFSALLSAFLNGYNIWNDQYANAYYTAAVASMLQSFHNFFFASFDPGGFVTVDKPPVVFWIQTASAALFGLHGWSVILPQALAGVGSVLLVYAMVKPTFGKGAARFAALAMACTPIAAAVSRTNNIDAMLVFTLLLGAWALFRGVRKGSLWSLLGAFALVGVAFNMKMLQAYMVLPAFYLFYLIASKVNWKKKIVSLSAASCVLLLVSLSWPVIVDSIPEDQRPYIGSSETNSVLELAFGYNGVSRLTGNRGQGGGGGGALNGAGAGFQNAGMDDGGAAAADERAVQAQTDGQAAGSGQSAAQTSESGQASDGGRDQTDRGGQDGQGPQGDQAGQGFEDGQGGFGGQDGRGGQDGQGGRGGQAGGNFGTGQKGALRLFQSELSGQASWLIPFAFIGAVGLFADFRRRNFTDRHKEALFWLAWLIPGMIFFSIAGFFHHYYLIMLAPPLAALVGAGWSTMWAHYRSSWSWTGWLLPAAVAVTTAFQWYVIHPYDSTIGSGWSIGIALAGAIVTLGLIVQKARKLAVPFWAGALALAVLLVGPLYWAATPITYGQSSQLPQAGPGTSNSFGGGGGMQPGQMQQPGGQDDGDRGSSQNDGGMAPGQQDGQDEGNGGMPGAGTAGGGSGGGMDDSGVNEELYAYLKEHNTGEKYLFATTRYNTAAYYIIDKRESVIAMGGYSGNDPIFTVEEIKEMVANGELKYFLITSGGMGGSSDITQWIEENGKAVSSSEYSSGSGSNSSGGTLYEVDLSNN